MFQANGCLQESTIGWELTESQACITDKMKVKITYVIVF